MPRRKQISKIIFRGIAGIFGIGLLVVGTAIFYTHQSSNQSLDKFLPSDVEYVVELQPSQYAEELIRARWGEQGTKTAYSHGRIVAWDEQTIFCQKNASNLEPTETLHYRGFEIMNLSSGQKYWQVENQGWVFEGEQITLRNLVDFWLTDKNTLANNSTWQELKNNSIQGDLNLFLLEEDGLWQGTSLTLKNQNIYLLTLLDRLQVCDLGYGQSRVRYIGSLLSSANPGAWLLLGGQDLQEQFAQTKMILQNYYPEIWYWLEFNFDLPELSEGEELLTWTNQTLQNYQVPTNDTQNDFAYADYQKYSNGAERWVALIYPEHYTPAHSFLDNLLGFSPEFIYIGGQTFDDRILTTIHFE